MKLSVSVTQNGSLKDASEKQNVLTSGTNRLTPVGDPDVVGTQPGAN